MKAVVLALVVLIVLAFVGQRQMQTASVVVCGEVHGGATLTARGVDLAEDFGNWIHDLAETPIDSASVKAAVEGVEKVLWYWARTWFLSSKGIKLDPEILKLQTESENAKQAAESQCTPCPTALPQDSSPLASLDVYGNTYGTDAQVSPSHTGEALVRDVAARYWPADQVDTAVAVAGAESTFNPKAHNNYGAGVEGLWQINVQAHRYLVAGKNLQDPSVNGFVAHQIWLDAGKSWSPWTTYTSGSYRKFLKPSAATAASSTTPAPDAASEQAAPVNPQNVGCQSAGMPEVRVATWNSYYGPRHPGATGPIGDLRIRMAMKTIGEQADVIGTQEMSEASHKRAAQDGLGDDWAAVGLDTSHPIWFRKSKFTLTSEQTQKVFERGTPMEGPDQGTRYIVTAVLRDVTSGKTLTVVNFHQIPTIEKSGKLNAAEPKRTAVAREIFAAAMTAARTHMAQGAVVVTGDTNFTRDPDGMYAQAGLTSVADVLGAPDQKSRSRDIDKILYSAGAPSSFRSLGQLGSDHQARVAVFASSDPSPVSSLVTAGSRTVTDPSSGKTYTIPIPTGPRGVAINFALDQLGKPYRWGGHGPNSWDCSGLVSAAWAKAGVDFTPQTSAMYREIPHVTSGQPGDLTWHADNGGHTQMLLPNGLIIEAPRTGLDVRIIEKNWMTSTATLDPTKMSGVSA